MLVITAATPPRPKMPYGRQCAARSWASRFRRQHAIGSYIVDFICVKSLLTIELDGEVHAEAGQAEYDRGRTHILTELGYRELRFTNHQVLHSATAGVSYNSRTLKRQ